MEPKPKINDRVMFNESPPFMTIVDIDGDEMACCEWIDHGAHQRRWFPIGTLKKVDPPSGPTVIGQNVIDRLDPERRHFPKV
jgi:uncharacterized protein YodC (DUF2158 family)